MWPNRTQWCGVYDDAVLLFILGVLMNLDGWHKRYLPDWRCVYNVNVFKKKNSDKFSMNVIREEWFSLHFRWALCCEYSISPYKHFALVLSPSSSLFLSKYKFSVVQHLTEIYVCTSNTYLCVTVHPQHKICILRHSHKPSTKSSHGWAVSPEIDWKKLLLVVVIVVVLVAFHRQRPKIRNNTATVRAAYERYNEAKRAKHFAFFSSSLSFHVHQKFFCCCCCCFVYTLEFHFAKLSDTVFFMHKNFRCACMRISLACLYV